MATSLQHSAIQLHGPGSTGTGRGVARGLQNAKRIAVEIVLEVVGGTPAFTFTVQGLEPGGDDTVAADWNDVQVVVPNSATAATATPSVTLSAGRTIFYVDGLDKRFFEAIAVNVSANTNVIFRTNVYSVQ